MKNPFIHLLYFLIIPIVFLLCLIDHNIVEATRETIKVIPLVWLSSILSMSIHDLLPNRENIAKIWNKYRGHIQAYTYFAFITWFSFFSDESRAFVEGNGAFEVCFMFGCYVLAIIALIYAFWKEFKSVIDFLSRIVGVIHKDFIAPIGFACVYAYLIKDKIAYTEAENPTLSIFLSALTVGSGTYVYQFVIRTVFLLVIDGLRDYYVKLLTKGKDEK